MSKSAVVRLACGFAMVALLAMVAQVSWAAMQAGKGNIVGTVQTHEGKPAVGLLIKLVKDIPIDMRRPGGRRSSGIDDPGAAGLQGGSPRTKIVAQATTDAQGKFTMNNVEEGSYRLEAGNKNIGWIYHDISVEANKTVELHDLKLAKLN